MIYNRHARELATKGVQLQGAGELRKWEHGLCRGDDGERSAARDGALGMIPRSSVTEVRDTFFS